MDFSYLKTVDAIISVYPNILIVDVEFSRMPDSDIRTDVKKIKNNPGFTVLKMSESKYMVRIPPHYLPEQIGNAIKSELMAKHNLTVEGKVFAANETQPVSTF